MDSSYENDIGILRGAALTIRLEANQHQGQLARDIRASTDRVEAAIARLTSDANVLIRAAVVCEAQFTGGSQTALNLRGLAERLKMKEQGGG